MSTTGLEGIKFDLPKNASNGIKVIGVGGGGSNAINHMFQQGINGVDFVICNTDAQALENSNVPLKIQLGVGLTEGLGAGAIPEVGEQAAIESAAEIKEMLGVKTKMIFITAGMGGGTGTGAAPVIASMAREMDILTVGIVTSPFAFEGKRRNQQALLGIEKLRASVDSLIVINNNKLREVYGNLGFKAGFSKADEVLSTAAKGIAEVITHHYTTNIDLKDAKSVLANSGTAIMGSAKASGANRAHEAITKALDSPLLNDNKITGATDVLLLIVSGNDEITIDEMGEINDHIQQEAGHNANIIMGIGDDEQLGDTIAVTIIATGFNVDQQADLTNVEPKKIIHTLEDEQKATQDLTPVKTSYVPPVVTQKKSETYASDSTSKIVYDLGAVEPEVDEPNSNYSKDVSIPSGVDSGTANNSDFTIIDVTASTENSDQNAPNTIMQQTVLPFDMGDTVTPKVNVKPSNNQLEVDLTLAEEHHSVAPVPVVEDVKRYNLNDFIEEEQIAEDSVKIKKEEIEIAQDDSLDIKIVQRSKVAQAPEKEAVQENDPLSSPIADLLASRSEERKKKMKAYNYKFHNNGPKHIDDIEKEPAYKRRGVELDDSIANSGTMSRTTLGLDDNDDIQLRRNNSFLHDNVD